MLISNPYCQPQQIIPALDVRKLDYATRLAAIFKELGVTFVKIGPELVSEYGVTAIRKALKPYVIGIFFDLKLRGTPDCLLRTLDTVRGKEHGVTLLTIMPDNGFRSVEKIVKEGGAEIKIMIPIGLSSDLESESVAMYGRGLKKQNRYWLDEIALASGAHGVVCGKTSLGLLKRHHQDLLPCAVGIRPEGEFLNDHTDAITPAKAINHYKAQFLIVGRPLIGVNPESTRENFQTILSNANNPREKHK